MRSSRPGSAPGMLPCTATSARRSASWPCSRPSLNEALVTARSKAYVIVDGTVLPIDRIAADQPYCSGKKRHHGMNVQVLTDPFGRLLWASPALPGATHDLTAARESTTSSTPSLTPASSTEPIRRIRARPATSESRLRGDAPIGGNDATTPPTPRSVALASRPWLGSRAGACWASCAAAPTASPRSSGPCSLCILRPLQDENTSLYLTRHMCNGVRCDGCPSPVPNCEADLACLCERKKRHH